MSVPIDDAQRGSEMGWSDNDGDDHRTPQRSCYRDLPRRSAFVGPRRRLDSDVRPELMERYLEALYVYEWADTNRPEGVR